VPEFPLVRVYLDSNVLLSASFEERSEFHKFWRLRAVTPVTSRYAIDEVSRNVRVPACRLRFEDLITRTEIVSDADVRFVPSHVKLIDKDLPILAAAIAASVDYLVTGDKKHFGMLYGVGVAGVHVARPGNFLLFHKDRLTG
jgi:uncharacterized protein